MDFVVSSGDVASARDCGLGGKGASGCDDKPYLSLTADYTEKQGGFAELD